MAELSVPAVVNSLTEKGVATPAYTIFKELMAAFDTLHRKAQLRQGYRNQEVVT